MLGLHVVDSTEKSQDCEFLGPEAALVRFHEWLNTLLENNRNNVLSPKTVTAATLSQQIELQAYDSCLTSGISGTHQALRDTLIFI